MTQLIDLLRLDVSDSSVEKWEKDLNRPSAEHRRQIVEFIGFDPADVKSTGGS